MYEIISDIKDPDFEESIIYTINGQKEKIKITQSDFENRKIRLQTDVRIFDKVTWAGEPIELKPLWEEKEGFISQGKLIRDDSDRYIIYLEDKSKKPDYYKEINKINSFVDFENLYYENGQPIDATREEGFNFTINDKSDLNRVVISNQLKFKFEKLARNNKEAYQIQLIENEDISNEEAVAISPLRYFFDDDVIITDENKNEYQVAGGIESEFKLILSKKKGLKNEFCFPETDILTVRINTYQVEKQLEAISTLMKMPVGAHRNLIKLFSNKEKTVWDKSNQSFINNWEVLTDDTRNGCREQRAFVNQALNTPDFAVLEGPPGSGKTTVIIELICQLVKQGKRILLCGSTHIAIDNVLERLNEKNGNQNLLEKFHILPVRIGDEKRVNEDVREFQINNFLENNTEISEDLLLEISNLVCGTTIGILQHPKFKKRKGKLNEKLQYFSNEPIVPEFDYLIIDESSKTTFQEFLVPALYAKKWILVGDVMQLSPFTERDEIVSNIEHITIENKQLPKQLQNAVFILNKLKDCLIGKYNKYVIPTDIKTIEFIEKELDAGRKEDFTKKLFFSLTNESKYSENDTLINRTIDQVSKLEMTAADVIFIDKNHFKKALQVIPETHCVLSDNWENTEHSFVHNNFQKSHSFYLKEKGQEIKNSFEISKYLNTYFKERSWAEEIAWRVDREYQLRTKQNEKRDNYTNAINEFLPKSYYTQSIEQEINAISAMAFPSILESLVKGIKGRKAKVQSTISEGFSNYELNSRRTILTYQHRMHPEISAFPRNQFYSQDKALLDLNNIERKRSWNYDRYSNRSIWLNVEGKTVRNRNEDEAKELIKELEEFLRFASENPQPEGKEWSVACLTFYRGQETIIREKLQKLTKKENAFSNFNYVEGRYKVNIKLHTVDKFQGHEADIVFLSMVQTQRDGFLDSPNRLNVAITRAKFQLVIIGNQPYFKEKSESEDLKQLAINTPIF